MNDPKVIKTIKDGALYELQYYKVTNEGLEDAGYTKTFKFCKGSKEDDTAFRQEGFFTETLLVTCKTYLEQNNVGQLKSEETAGAIIHIDAALKCLQDRADKRKASGVQGTYRPTPVEAVGPIAGEAIGPENS